VTDLGDSRITFIALFDIFTFFWRKFVQKRKKSETQLCRFHENPKKPEISWPRRPPFTVFCPWFPEKRVFFGSAPGEFGDPFFDEPYNDDLCRINQKTHKIETTILGETPEKRLLDIIVVLSVILGPDHRTPPPAVPRPKKR